MIINDSYFLTVATVKSRTNDKPSSKSTVPRLWSLNTISHSKEPGSWWPEMYKGTCFTEHEDIIKNHWSYQLKGAATGQRQDNLSIQKKKKKNCNKLK